MNDFPTEFKNEAYRLRMTEAERSRVRARVLRATRTRVQSPYMTAFSFMTHQRSLAYAFSFVVILLGGTGGTLYASEGALPGDTLYTIKTSVTEPLSGVFAVSREAETEWHAKLAVKRLTEAEELAKAGRLTDENGVELAVAFTKHVAAIETDTAEEAVSVEERDSVSTETTLEEARETFEAVVAAKGASILEATDTEDRRGQRVASAHFVLSVLGGGADSADSVMEDAAADARMTKSATTQDDQSVALMTLSTPAPEGEVLLEEESLESLKKRAKESFQAARERVEDSGSRDSYRELSLILRLLVRSEAESVTGNTDSARSGFLEATLRADAITAEERTDDEGEVEGWMDSIDERERRDRAREEDTHDEVEEERDVHS
ncbi:MAG: hypothetical protein KBC38_02775 [Candidatus Pacebacteria bacterium]|nr:hypothetical protein [Candidatus Paceibacterota bacterium]MBP9840319.1 hypothetical protein [Candidatus Paceibacterota bacterium]